MLHRESCNFSLSLPLCRPQNRVKVETLVEMPHGLTWAWCGFRLQGSGPLDSRSLGLPGLGCKGRPGTMLQASLHERPACEELPGPGIRRLGKGVRSRVSLSTARIAPMITCMGYRRCSYRYGNV